jgi:hypothetical protein
LHFSRLHPPDSFQYESHHSPYLRTLPIPSIGSLRVLLSHILAAFRGMSLPDRYPAQVTLQPSARLRAGSPSILIELDASFSPQPPWN